MSEVTAVETAAPVEAPVEQPVVTASEPQLNAAERRQGVRDRASGRSVAAAVNNVTQPRDEAGRFASASTTEPAAVTETATTEVVAGEASTEAVAGPTPAVTERIEIPVGHPLRDRGKQYLDELTTDELRGTLNSAVRAREVEQVRTTLRQESEARLRAEAEAKALREMLVSSMTSPEQRAIAAKYEELAAWDKNEADDWLRGKLAKINDELGSRVSEFTEQHQQQVLVQSVQQFERDVQEFANTALSAMVVNPKFPTALANARQRYGIALELAESQGESVSLDLNTFINNYLAPEIDRWPEVQQFKAHQSEQERQRLIEQTKQEALREAEARQREEALAVQQTRNRNPLARIPANANVAQQVNVTPPSNAASIRQSIRDRLRGR